MAESKLVLLIDNDRIHSASLGTLLAVTGKYRVVEATDVRAAEDALATSKSEFKVIVMDIGPRSDEEIEACARFRHRHKDMVIILMSASDDELQLVRGLQAGADDFVRKPFRSREFLARLEARLRHSAVNSDAAIPVGNFMFHAGQRTLVDSSRNVRIRLAEKEAKLLWNLYLGNGDVVSRVSLLHAVWGYSRAATSHTVETHVYRLRQKVEPDPTRPALILTERGGYRLTGLRPMEPAPFSVPLRPHISRFAS